MKKLYLVILAVAFLWNAGALLAQSPPVLAWEYATGLEKDGGKIFALASNPDGNILYAAVRTGILIVTRVTPTQATEKFVDLSFKVDKIYLRGQEVYLLTNGRIVKTDPNFQNLTSLHQSTNMVVSELAFDSKGAIWAISGFNAFSLSAGSDEWINHPEANSGAHVLVDKSDNVWFGSFNPNAGVIVRQAVDGQFIKISLWNEQRKSYEYPSIAMTCDNENVYIAGATHQSRQAIYILSTKQLGQYVVFNDDGRQHPIMPSGFKAIQMDENGTLWAMEGQGAIFWNIPAERNEDGWHRLLLGLALCNNDLIIVKGNIYCSVFSNLNSNIPYQIRGYQYQFDTTAVEEPIVSIPTIFHLDQNFPNPFNPATTIRYSLVKPSNVKLTVYDMLGREVATLVNERQSEGNHETVFNGSNLPSGVYFGLLVTDSGVKKIKMTLMK